MRFLVSLAVGLALAAIATAAAPDPAYVRVTEERGAKIAAALELADPAKRERVGAIVARQYRDRSAIHGARDTRIAAAKGKPGAEAETQAARAEADAQLAKLHGEFLARLAVELTPAQVDQVKDSLTYGVAPNTFRVYQEMLPNLTAVQKEQIHAWLVEARELAMDAGTSDEKHAVFGKYKGRINNFLAAADIDLKQAEKDLAARRKAEAAPATK
jgi:hypothetical protein